MDIGNPPFRAPFRARQVHTEELMHLHLACNDSDEEEATFWRANHALGSECLIDTCIGSMHEPTLQEFVRCIDHPGPWTVPQLMLMTF
jgi:hypothetical protein